MCDHETDRTGMMKESDLGQYFVDADGEVWRLTGYTEQPTARLVREKDGRSIRAVVGSIILQEFRRLVPEDPADAPEPSETHRP